MIDGETLAIHNKIFNADLFTMIYFISEVFAFREEARDFFEHLFKKAKTGALFLFVDNSSYKFYNWFDELAKQNGLEIIKKQNYFSFQTEGDEEKEDLGCYYDKFHYPKLQADIAYRIYRKAEGKEPIALDW